MNYKIDIEPTMKIEASDILEDTIKHLLSIATAIPADPFTGCAVIYPEDIKDLYENIEEDFESNTELLLLIKDEILKILDVLEATREEPVRILLLF